MKRIPYTEWEAMLRVQARGAGHRDPTHLAVVCVMCGTVQSVALLQRYSTRSPDDLLQMLGFSCVGRLVSLAPSGWTAAAAPTPRLPDLAAPGCDWTLGGLFHLHKLEVEVKPGKFRPTFELATPELAKQLMDMLMKEPV